MGCNSSSAPLSPILVDNRRTNVMASRIKEAIAFKREAQMNEVHPITLEKIVLKFEKMKEVLGTIKKIFQAHSNDNGKSISKAGLNKVMSRLHSDLSEDDVSQLFDFIDLDTSDSIDFKEFLVSLSVCMVLGKLSTDKIGSMEKDEEAPTPIAHTRKVSTNLSSLAAYKTECIEMLNLIVSAYLIFDPQGSGSIKKAQVEKILEEASSKATHLHPPDLGQNNHFLSADMWQTMDWNHDGGIDFGEFVYSFTNWIDVDELIMEE